MLRSKIRLIHWNASEAASYLTLLKDAGHTVEYNPEFSPRLMRDWKSAPPDAFVIDLSRLPSHGREIAIALRQAKATRAVPLVFCNGDEDKIAKTREILPDAVYCPLARLKSSLRGLPKAMNSPVVPLAMMDRYAARTTAQKLGVKGGDKVCLLDAPRDVHACLEPTEFVDSPTEASVTLLFATELQEMRSQLSELRSTAGQTKLWVCWKKGKSAENGIGERLVRETGLSLGLVDYKICSINQVWSGLLFASKKANTR
jgi:hypothetical protein